MVTSGKLIALCGIALAVAGCMDAERNKGPDCQVPDSPARANLFGTLKEMGWPGGQGEAQLSDGGMIISCEHSRLPCSLRTWMELPGIGSKGVGVRYVFIFPSEQLMRVGEVRIETTLPAVSAEVIAKPLGKASSVLKPKVALEFELLIAVGVSDSDGGFVGQALVRSRLIRFWDDMDIRQWAESRGGESWLAQTPVTVFVTTGAPVFSIESRACEKLPWMYTLIELPVWFRGWLRKGAQTLVDRERPMVVTAAQGYYMPTPQK